MTVPKAQPGRVVELGHIVLYGACMSEGDVIVLPYGDHHVISGEAPAERVSIVTLLDPLPWPDLPLRHHGGAEHGRSSSVGICIPKTRFFQHTQLYVQATGERL